MENQSTASLTYLEEEIEALIADDMHWVAGNIFSERPPMIFKNKPALTYT